MKLNESLDGQLMLRCAKGDAAAADFLMHWLAYVHDVDDLVDGDMQGTEFLMAMLIRALNLYTHPFFKRHEAALKQQVINITNAYADSVPGEHSGEEWERTMADVQRHAGVEMVLAVASICGGWEHTRSVSRRLRELCNAGHPWRAERGRRHESQ